jgi:hypothetical protein
MLLLLGSSRVCWGALLTDFAGSFAKYEERKLSPADFDGDAAVDGRDFLAWQRGAGFGLELDNERGDANGDRVVNRGDLDVWTNHFGLPPVGVPDSVAFKLYFDPEGILEGQVTVVVDVPESGQSRLAVGVGNGLIEADPRYSFTVMESVTNPPGREHFEAKVHFTLKSGEEPPAGPVTLFGYQVQDRFPELNLLDPQNRFEFEQDDFITVRSPDETTTTFNESQLTDVDLPLNVPLILDVTLNAVHIRNPSAAPISILAYELTSRSGRLIPTGWVSLDDAEADPPGMGWDEAGGADSNALAETNLTGVLSLASTQSRSLGDAWEEDGPPGDLMFTYIRLGGPSGTILESGVVNYNYNGTNPISAVPEPASLGLGMLMLAGLMRRGRRDLRPQNYSWRCGPASIATLFVAVCCVALTSSSTSAIVLLSDGFESYADTAAFTSAWPVVAGVGGTLSTEESNEGQNSARFAAASNGPQNERLFSANQPNAFPGAMLWSVDFYDETDESPNAELYPQFATLQDIPPGGFVPGDTIALGLNNNQTGNDSGGQFYMARISGFAPGNSPDPDGGPSEGGTLGAGAFFKLNDFGVGTKNEGWHTLSVMIRPVTAQTGIDIHFSFYVDDELAERTVINASPPSVPQYRRVRLGSGQASTHGTFFDNVTVEEFLGGDLDDDGDLDITDYLAFSTHLHAPATNLPPKQALLFGDLTLDGMVNASDYHEFYRAYDSFNGVGAFASMVASLPEPAAATLLAAALLCILSMRRRRTSAVDPSVAV